MFEITIVSEKSLQETIYIILIKGQENLDDSKFIDDAFTSKVW